MTTSHEMGMRVFQNFLDGRGGQLNYEYFDSGRKTNSGEPMDYWNLRITFRLEQPHIDLPTLSALQALLWDFWRVHTCLELEMQIEEIRLDGYVSILIIDVEGEEVPPRCKKVGLRA